MRKSFIQIGLYTTLCYLSLSPFQLGILKTMGLSIILALFLGFLTEIITQLRKLNGEKFD